MLVGVGVHGLLLKGLPQVGDGVGVVGSGVRGVSVGVVSPSGVRSVLVGVGVSVGVTGVSVGVGVSAGVTGVSVGMATTGSPKIASPARPEPRMPTLKTGAPVPAPVAILTL